MSQQPPQRAMIRAAFSAAAPGYEQAANIQRRILQRLAGFTPAPCNGRLLDAGAGTGQALALLRAQHPQAELLCVDAALGMSQRAGGICADIEALPLASGSIAHYWSSLAWQWTDPARAASEAFRVLAPGGMLQVATLGPRTLWELREAFAAIDAHAHVRRFTPRDALLAAVTQAGFRLRQVQQEDQIWCAPDLRSLLRELRAVGAHSLDAPRRPGLLSRQAWQSLLAAYEQHRLPAGLPATYDVIHLIAERP